MPVLIREEMDNQIDLGISVQISTAGDQASGIRLYNFAVGGTEPTLRHREVIRGMISRFLRRPGALGEFYGMASLTGSDQVNERLSKDRALRVGELLDDVPIEKLASGEIIIRWFGDEAPRQLGHHAEGKENDEDRAVYVYLFPNRDAANECFNESFRPWARTHPNAQVG